MPLDDKAKEESLVKLKKDITDKFGPVAGDDQKTEDSFLKALNEEAAKKDIVLSDDLNKDSLIEMVAKQRAKYDDLLADEYITHEANILYTNWQNKIQNELNMQQKIAASSASNPKNFFSTYKHKFAALAPEPSEDLNKKVIMSSDASFNAVADYYKKHYFDEYQRNHPKEKLDFNDFCREETINGKKCVVLAFSTNDQAVDLFTSMAKELNKNFVLLDFEGKDLARVSRDGKMYDLSGKEMDRESLIKLLDDDDKLAKTKNVKEKQELSQHNQEDEIKKEASEHKLEETEEEESLLNKSDDEENEDEEDFIKKINL